MSIVFRSDASAYGSTSLTISKPSGTAENDIMIMAVVVKDTVAVGTLPEGWTRFAQTQSPSSSGVGFFAWKRAGSSEPSSYTITDLDDSCCGSILSFSGCVTSGDPIITYGSRANAAYNGGTDGISVGLAAGTVIVVAACVMANYGCGSWYGTDPAVYDEEAWYGTSTGSDSRIEVAWAKKEEPGHTGSTSFSCGYENVGLICALIPSTVQKIGNFRLTSIYEQINPTRIGNFRVTGVYEQQHPTRIGNFRNTVVYREEARNKVGNFRITVVYTEQSQVGMRVFPVPHEKTVWQSQSGKREFPLIGVQDIS